MGFELKLSAHVILGIESSCDDTAAAIVSYEKGNSKILSSVVVNQNTLHEKYGGDIVNTLMKIEYGIFQRSSEEHMRARLDLIKSEL